MEKIEIYSDFITLGQALKYAGIVCNGGEIKAFLENETVKVNQILEKRRGEKLFPGDIIEINEKKYAILSKIA